MHSLEERDLVESFCLFCLIFEDTSRFRERSVLKSQEQELCFLQFSSVELNLKMPYLYPIYKVNRARNERSGESYAMPLGAF